MLVSNLQQFLHLLLPPLRAAGLNSTADKSLEAMTTALDPFKDLSIEQLADLLKMTQEYRQTGQIPDWVLARKPAASKPRSSATKAPKATKPPKMTPAEALEKLRDLQDRSSDFEVEQINQELEGLKVLTVSQLKEVHEAFLGAVRGKNKPDLLEGLKREVFSRRESRLRSKGILGI